MSRVATLTIRTPEGIVFSLPLAGPVSRFLALAIDLCCIALGGGIINLVVALIRPLSLDLAMAIATYLYFGLSIGYGMGMEWLWRGQTIGKRVMGLRVVDDQGLRLHPSQIVTRNLLRFVDLLPAFYCVGGVAAVCGSLGQRLGDLAAGTVVVRAARPLRPDLALAVAGKFNSLREIPHLEARLRQRVAPRVAALALRAVLRRDELSPPARVALFRDVAAHLRTLVEFPPEATEGLSDEQYVRNVVDIVYRRPADAKRAAPAPSPLIAASRSGTLRAP
jgi:uncharacterized RDD family membrane protein YckC